MKIKILPPFLFLALHAANALANLSAGNDESVADQRRFRLMPALYYSSVDPKDVNAALSRPDLQGVLSGAWGLNLSMSHETGHGISLGFRLDYFNSSLKRSKVMNGATKFSDETKIEALTPYVTVTTRHALNDRLNLGVTTGLGLPIFYELEHSVAHISGGTTYKGGATYAARPISVYGALFGSYSVTKRASITCEVGYRLLNAGVMRAKKSGTDQSRTNINQGDTLRSNGSDVKVDASAPYVNLGVTITI